MRRPGRGSSKWVGGNLEEKENRCWSLIRIKLKFKNQNFECGKYHFPGTKDGQREDDTSTTRYFAYFFQYQILEGIIQATIYL